MKFRLGFLVVSAAPDNFYQSRAAADNPMDAAWFGLWMALD